jgi:NADH-quinone oxidoreductase subunit C
MTLQEIAQKLSEHFRDSKIECVEGAKHPVTGVTTGDPFLVVPAEKIKEICQTLKVMDPFSFDCLSNLTAVDRKDRFEMVYQLFSYQQRHSATLKVYLSRDDNAHIETVESLWRCANWLEREVYDLFGIKFDGHSDLRRIMLPDDWVGYPLRKDYKEQEDYHGISTTRAPLIQ